MQKTTALIILILLFLGLFALLKNAHKLIPDLGRVVEKNGVSCVKFRNGNKNYVWGEIEVKFVNNLTGIEAHRLLKTESLNLKDSEIESYATGSAYVVDVPRGDEENFVKKLENKQGVEKVNLVHCE
jgi:hypothetical protein